MNGNDSFCFPLQIYIAGNQKKKYSDYIGAADKNAFKVLIHQISYSQ